MALKIIQDAQIPRLSPAVGVAITSTAIALRSGYLRITIGSTGNNSGGYIAIGTSPSVSRNSFHVVPYGTDIIKETMKRQVIAGVTTGTTTTLTFANNSGNPFESTDYVTITGAPTAGINTSHNSIVSLNDYSVTINFNSSAITSPDITGAALYKSIKVACLTDDVNTFFNISEVVTLVSE
jgi:hypothetical protein